MNKIQGFARKQLKKELAKLKSYEKNFCFWSGINEDMYEVFNIHREQFKQSEKQLHDHLIKRIEELQSILKEKV